MILGAKGVKPDMLFSCCDCGENFTGQQVIDDQVELSIISVNKADPIKSVFRCECCQDDFEDKA